MNRITPEMVKQAAARIGWTLRYQVYHYFDTVLGHCGCPQAILYCDSNPDARPGTHNNNEIEGIFIDKVCQWADTNYGLGYAWAFRRGFDGYDYEDLPTYYGVPTEGQKEGYEDGRTCRETLLLPKATIG